MADTTLFLSISRSDSFPKMVSITAPANKGYISVTTHGWTDQMFYELPAIKFELYVKYDNTYAQYKDFCYIVKTSDIDDGVYQNIDRALTISNIPSESCIVITPLFDNTAFESHNNLVINGLIDGVVWDQPTTTFDIESKFISISGPSPTPAVLITKEITQNGTYLASDDDADGYSEVDVNVSGGGSTAVESDVTFYDYDGTIVKSYTANDFATIEALPENPAHTGLTAQGWNWSLEDAKTYVAAYGKLNIGQTYITDDGKTRIYITLRDGRLQPQLGLGINGSVEVDWGDGTAHDTMTGSNVNSTVYRTHVYPSEGDYTITITIDGSVQFNGSTSYGYLLTKQSGDSYTNRVYLKSINRVEIGQNVVNLYTGCFNLCYSMNSITIPKEISSIGERAFSSCNSLSSVTIPSGLSSIGTNAFYGCSSLSVVTLPKSLASISTNMFYYCYSLSSITIPQGVTTIESSAFNYCYNLSTVIIPQGVTTIKSNAFTYCTSLSNIPIPQGVTSIGDSAFTYCYLLENVEIKTGITSIGYGMFTTCSSLKHVTLPQSLTSIGASAFSGCTNLLDITIPPNTTTIGNSAFSSCMSLSSITIPKNVTSIGTYSFGSCFGLGKIVFQSSTPPALGNSNAFSSVPTDCKIYVPQGSLATYTSAQYYPSSSTYTYVEY